jgi:HEAT repeat protein
MSRLDDLFSGDDERAQAALNRVTSDDMLELTGALAEGDRDARSWAAAALARLGGPEAVRALLAASADPDPDVRALILHALGEVRAPEAVTPLLFALGERDSYLTRIATDALIRLGSVAVPPLIAALEHEVETRVRVNLARALALIGDPRAIPALFCALDDESYLVQHWADEGLERMGVGQVYFRP